jgi:hypothetical protein
MKYSIFLYEAKNTCPKATYDLSLNLENRQHAIDEYGYGPMNPLEPSEDFWNGKADIWLVSKEDAKSSRCGNCAAFVVTSDMIDCITKGKNHGDVDKNEVDHFDTTIKKSNLGYCNLLHFKCAGERTCDAWLVGGPITDGDI